MVLVVVPTRGNMTHAQSAHLWCWPSVVLGSLNQKPKCRPVVLASSFIGSVTQSRDPQPTAIPANKRPEFLLRYLCPRVATQHTCRPVVLAYRALGPPNPKSMPANKRPELLL